MTLLNQLVVLMLYAEAAAGDHGAVGGWEAPGGAGAAHPDHAPLQVTTLSAHDHPGTHLSNRIFAAQKHCSYPVLVLINAG